MKEELFISVYKTGYSSSFLIKLVILLVAPRNISSYALKYSSTEPDCNVQGLGRRLADS
jgi:hypothetical protein